MDTIYKIVAGMGTLIAIYLFLNNYQASVSIVRQLGSSSTSMVKTLQGR
ncbi:MAG: hypothetical protein IJW78_04805 [Clostridia bacterium]|nr:hypothetical protein [Clostridia bacterium]